MKNEFNRRRFVQAIGTAGLSAALKTIAQGEETSRADGERRYRFVQIDVFTSRRLEGNALAVVPDAGGLSDEEMQALARETNLQETTFVFPRSAAIEREQGVKVRIFVPNEEIPFGGHPTLGTAMVLRNLRLAKHKRRGWGSRSRARVGKCHYVDEMLCCNRCYYAMLTKSQPGSPSLKTLCLIFAGYC